MNFPLTGVFFVPFTMVFCKEEHRGLVCFKPDGLPVISFESGFALIDCEREALANMLGEDKARILFEIQQSPTKTVSTWNIVLGVTGSRVEIVFDCQVGGGGYVEIIHTETGDSGVMEIVHDPNGAVGWKTQPGTLWLAYPFFRGAALNRLAYGHVGSFPFTMKFPKECVFAQPAVRAEDEPMNPCKEVSDAMGFEAVPADPLLRFFAYQHLPLGPLRTMSVLFQAMALHVTRAAEPSAERTVCLRKLLEAKDAGVRSVIPTEKANA